MKVVEKKFIIFILFIIYSCGQSSNEKKNIDIKKTPISNYEKAEKDRKDRRRLIEEQNRIDSLQLSKILDNALKIVNENKEKLNFKKSYSEKMIDSSYNVDVEISLDYYFTNKNPHWIIRRNAPNTIYIDIFSKYNNVLKKVLSHEQWAMEYVNDTIQDVNGDNIKDFVVNWYGLTGCCLKAFKNVYLLKRDEKTFSQGNEFINPTFSPNEKIIRGVCYGHPGYTEMYKYKWNGEIVDTLEYVYYETDKSEKKTGRIIISNHEPYHKDFKILKIVKKVPREYKKISGYDWFLGNP
jgi:hypothetical protein